MALHVRPLPRSLVRSVGLSADDRLPCGRAQITATGSVKFEVRYLYHCMTQVGLRRKNRVWVETWVRIALSKHANLSDSHYTLASKDPVHARYSTLSANLMLSFLTVQVVGSVSRNVPSPQKEACVTKILNCVLCGYDAISLQSTFTFDCGIDSLVVHHGGLVPGFSTKFLDDGARACAQGAWDNCTLTPFLRPRHPVKF